MTGVGTLVDLLLFYSLKRILFNRMVSSVGKTSHQVKRAIALWLPLEEIGYYDLIRTIHSLNDHSVNALFSETLKYFDCLPLNAASQVESPDVFPAFVGLFDEPMNYGFFYYNREFLFRRFQYIMQAVCEKISGETAALEVDNLGLSPVVRTPGSTASGKLSQEPRQSTFESSRRGFPCWTNLKRCQKAQNNVPNVLQRNWGDHVVHDVVVEQTGPARDPQFGRVVFTTSLVIPSALNGQAKAKFIVNGKHPWARIYVQRARA